MELVNGVLLYHDNQEELLLGKEADYYVNLQNVEPKYERAWHDIVIRLIEETDKKWGHVWKRGDEWSSIRYCGTEAGEALDEQMLLERTEDSRNSDKKNQATGDKLDEEMADVAMMLCKAYWLSEARELEENDAVYTTFYIEGDNDMVTEAFSSIGAIMQNVKTAEAFSKKMDKEEMAMFNSNLLSDYQGAFDILWRHFESANKNIIAEVYYRLKRIEKKSQEREESDG